MEIDPDPYDYTPAMVDQGVPVPEEEFSTEHMNFLLNAAS
jgi:hypothetical protein